MSALEAAFHAPVDTGMTPHGGLTHAVSGTNAKGQVVALCGFELSAGKHPGKPLEVDCAHCRAELLKPVRVYCVGKVGA